MSEDSATRTKDDEPKPLAGDAATVSVFVAVSPHDAFEVFTQETDLWWRKGPRFRVAGKRRGTLAFEPGLGGRLFETFELTAGPSPRSHTVEVGRITAWEPGRTLAFEWRGVNFRPGEKTFVEITFAPKREGTMVTVRHHGFAALPSDHPVRHGLESAAFLRMMGMWWGDLMTSLRERVTERAEERRAASGEMDSTSDSGQRS